MSVLRRTSDHEHISTITTNVVWSGEQVRNVIELQRVHSFSVSIIIIIILLTTIVVRVVVVYYRLERFNLAIASLPRVYHLIRNPTTNTQACYGIKLNQKQVHPRVIDSTNFPVRLESVSLWFLGHCSRFLSKAVQLWSWYIQEWNVCSFSNIASHRNRLLLILNHLVMRILTRRHRPVT
jgi:preprotein translocase subunit SecY